MDSDQDYILLRDALLQDESRDQRIHNWISSQYDFALSEIESEDYLQACSSSRPDSPLLGFSEYATTVATSTTHEHSRSSSQETDVCPSYDPLFFSVASQENLSIADQEFEDRERERALKSLIEDMNLWREFPRLGVQHNTQDQEYDREKVFFYFYTARVICSQLLPVTTTATATSATLLTIFIPCTIQATFSHLHAPHHQLPFAFKASSVYQQHPFERAAGFASRGSSVC